MTKLKITGLGNQTVRLRSEQVNLSLTVIEREVLRQARAWSLDALDVLQPEVLAADRACKTTGSPDGLIAERLALTIAGRARRLGL